MDKKALSEADIISKYIMPAVKQSGWDDMLQIRQEVALRDGKVIVRGNVGMRKTVKSADIVLYHKPNMPLAVIEAKANKHEIGKGMQQGLDYARLLDVPFAFASNGDGFIFHDKTAPANGGQLETEISLEDFPSPQELWAKFCAYKGYTEHQFPFITQDYFDDGSDKAPRYYQLQAINKTVEAISRGQNRNLLVMTTGTGKTYTAFQIIWRLWKAKQKKRILFLADRNILVDQTRINDFQPFGEAMTKITGRTVDPAYEIHLALYQALTGPEESQKAYKQLQLLPLLSLGNAVDAFKIIESNDDPLNINNSESVLTCTIKGFTAKGKRTANGFVVFKGYLKEADRMTSLKTWQKIRVKLRAMAIYR